VLYGIYIINKYTRESSRSTTKGGGWARGVAFIRRHKIDRAASAAAS